MSRSRVLRPNRFYDTIMIPNDEKQLAPFVLDSIAYVDANDCRVRVSELSSDLLDLWVTGYPVYPDTPCRCSRSEAVNYIVWQVFEHVCRVRFGVRLQPYEPGVKFRDRPKPFRHFAHILQYAYYARVTGYNAVDFDIFDMPEYWRNERRAWLVPVNLMLRGWWQAVGRPDGGRDGDFDAAFARIVRSEGQLLSERYKRWNKERQGR